MCSHISVVGRVSAGCVMASVELEILRCFFDKRKISHLFSPQTFIPLNHKYREQGRTYPAGALIYMFLLKIYSHLYI